MRVETHLGYGIAVASNGKSRARAHSGSCDVD